MLWMDLSQKGTINGPLADVTASCMSSHTGLQLSRPPAHVAGDSNYQTGPNFKKERWNANRKSLDAIVQL